MTGHELHRFIREYLEKNKVKPFWVASAMEYIEKVIYGNGHFLTSVSSPELVVHRDYKCVEKFSFKAKASIPDKNLADQEMLVTYTFDPDAVKNNHKVTIKAAKKN